MDPRRHARTRTGGAFADLVDDGPGVASPPDADDATAARAARTCYAEHGLRCVEADPAVRALLAAGERVVAASHDIVVRARPESGGGGGRCPDPGDLYVTTRRLVIVGDRVTSLSLDEVRDAAVAHGSLLLMLDGGRAMAIDTPRPRLLRVQIANARAERAAAVRGGTGSAGPPHGDSGR